MFGKSLVSGLPFEKQRTKQAKNKNKKTQKGVGSQHLLFFQLLHEKQFFPISHSDALNPNKKREGRSSSALCVWSG